jgi:DNA-binding response OmpR family regulator
MLIGSYIHGLRLLIADDDKEFAELLAQRLTRLGAEVTCCGDAGACLRQFQADAPNAVIVDGHLPGNDGLWLARQLQSSRPDIPLLMLSGNSDQSFMAAASEEGISRFLLKPCSFVKIDAAVREAARPTQLSADHATAKIEASIGGV